jgi:hypothetical protein
MNNYESSQITSESSVSAVTAPALTTPTLVAPTLWLTIRNWNRRQRWAAVVGSVVVALGIGLPTDVIPNPVFGRPVPVTWWSYPVLIATAVLGGLLIATYVRVTPRVVAAAADVADVEDPAVRDGEVEIDAPSRQGSIGGLLSFFAVGCPVCNKLVVVALGTTGARQWFEPLQPVLAVASIVLLAYALRGRIRSAVSCPVDAKKSAPQK